jgi:1-acyl-sn-glycerol-3-phosphate acyltransferase
VPQTGKLVVVSNHASYFDPPIVSCAVGRPVAFMAKEELFRVPVLREGIRLYGAYPVKRGSSDRSAIRAAMDSLEQGWAAGLFLQGTRSPDARITEPKLGAALIAAMAKAPILPVSLWGTERILCNGGPWPVPVTVRIGRVIEPPGSTQRDCLETKVQECARVINEMHDLGR